jgi:hypothetical protein
MRSKRINTLILSLVLVMFSADSFNPAQAGIFGKYGNLRPILGPEGEHVWYDCNYSLSSNCRRSDWVL